MLETPLDLESLLCGDDDPVHVICVNCHADPPYLSLCGKDCTQGAELTEGDISCLACSAVVAEAESRLGVKDLCEVGLCCGCGREC